MQKFMTKQRENIYDKYSSRLYYTAGHVVVAGILVLFLNYQILFPLPWASTSASCGSLPNGVTHTFVPKLSGPLVALPRLGYWP